MKRKDSTVSVGLLLFLVVSCISTYFIVRYYTEYKYDKFYNESQYTEGTVIDVMKDDGSYDTAYEYYIDGTRYVASDYMSKYIEKGMKVSVYYNSSKPEYSILSNSQKSLVRLNKVINGT